MMNEKDERDSNVPDPEVDKKTVEKDRDFKRACQRYARMRSRGTR